MQKFTDRSAGDQLYGSAHFQYFEASDENGGLYDMKLGDNRLVITKKPGDDIALAQIKLPSKSESAGMYFIEVQTGGPTTTRLIDAESKAILVTLTPGAYRVLACTGFRWVNFTVTVLT